MLHESVILADISRRPVGPRQGYDPAAWRSTSSLSYQTGSASSPSVSQACARLRSDSGSAPGRGTSPSARGRLHFIEHLLFKGTSRYSAQEIAEIFDELGGELNAATSRETTVVYARIPDERSSGHST